MKRAPVIPKTIVNISPKDVSTSPISASPIVDSLISRVGSMTRGNSISIPVCGREVKFVLETIPADLVESTSCVWEGNERDQDLLTEDSLDDLIPSFIMAGQQTPAFGRRASNIIEVADGSRRRKTAILTSRDYRVLVGDLDNEQMDALCKLGNDYRPTSAYERGKRYAYRLEHEFSGNISALADAENISRKIITRCVNTSKLPKDVIALFSHPGELSARTGEALLKTFSGKEDVLISQTRKLHEQKLVGIIFESDEIISLLEEALVCNINNSKEEKTKYNFHSGVTALYKGNKVVINIDRSRIPPELFEKIEAMLKSLKN